MKYLPRTRIFLALLLACTELLMSAPKTITLFPNPPLGCVKVPLKSNPIPYPEYLYLSMSAFLDLDQTNNFLMQN